MPYWVVCPKPTALCAYTESLPSVDINEKWYYHEFVYCMQSKYEWYGANVLSGFSKFWPCWCFSNSAITRYPVKVEIYQSISYSPCDIWHINWFSLWLYITAMLNWLNHISSKPLISVLWSYTPAYCWSRNGIIPHTCCVYCHSNNNEGWWNITMTS